MGIGPGLRRFGGVLDRTDEIAGLLRAGQLVGLPTERSLRGRDRVGQLHVERLEAALATGTPVVPVALVGREAGRQWHISVGAPIAPEPEAGPLAAVELAEAVRAATQHLLEAALPSNWWL
jgi:1-acyl-sn-glycerol-3-phosphate acyltransferase